jgi:hypothetical protein
MMARSAGMDGAYGAVLPGHKGARRCRVPPGTRADDSIDLFLPRETLRIRIWVEKICLM